MTLQDAINTRVDAYIEQYAFIGDEDESYSPDIREKLLLKDAILKFIAETSQEPK